MKPFASVFALTSFLAACSSEPTAPFDGADFVLAPEITGTLEVDEVNPNNHILFCAVKAQLVGNVEWTDLYLTFFIEIKNGSAGQASVQPIFVQPIIVHRFPAANFVYDVEHAGLRYGYGDVDFYFDAEVRFLGSDGKSHSIVKRSRCALPKAA
jgi:hypothetical protein